MSPGAPFEMSSFGARLRERTEPLAPDDERWGWAHAILCEAMALPFKEMADVIDPPDPYPPWSPLFHIDLCPIWGLPWLAQIVGVRLPPGLDDAQMREAIVGLSAQAQGSPSALRVAIGLSLTGSKTVYFRERDAGDAYRLEVVTLASQTPDVEQARRNLISQKPAGIILSFRTTAGWDYQALRDSPTYLTYANVRDTPDFDNYSDFLAGPNP
jgi:hypothetical protein